MILPGRTEAISTKAVSNIKRLLTWAWLSKASSSADALTEASTTASADFKSAWPSNVSSADVPSCSLKCSALAAGLHDDFSQ